MHDSHPINIPEKRDKATLTTKESNVSKYFQPIDLTLSQDGTAEKGLILSKESKRLFIHQKYQEKETPLRRTYVLPKNFQCFY